VNALVLGIGNILLSDEGVGVRAVEALNENYVFPEGVDLIDGGTAGFELLSMISNREHLIIIDAIACGQEPGTVVRIEGDDVRATFSERISPHQLGISDVLAACSLTGEMPGNLVLFGVEPKDMQTSLNLSDEVAASLPKLIDSVARELVAIGCAPLADVSSVAAG